MILNLTFISQASTGTIIVHEFTLTDILEPHVTQLSFIFFIKIKIVDVFKWSAILRP